MFQDGSVLQDTVQAHVTEFRTHLSVDSPEPDAEIERVLRLAKRTCYAEQLVRHGVPLKSTYQVNGEPRELHFDE